jgi:hypothetical protein
MRYPPDDATDQPSRRRRNQQSYPAPVSQGDPSSVFVPGYDVRRQTAQPDHTSGQAPGRWYGSAAGDAAGKGPVRGFPPQPGQPPPTYPPGQFSPWNRSASGRGRHSAAARPDQQAGGGWQASPADTGSGYYGPDGETSTDPGYSRLAVSDPAADVTSTQTWQAIADGRATGTWRSPASPRPARTGPDAAPAGMPASPAGMPASAAGPGAAELTPGAGSAELAPGGAASGPGTGGPASGGHRLAPWSPQAAAQRTEGTNPAGARADGLTRDSGPYGRAGIAPGAGRASGVAARPDPGAGVAPVSDSGPLGAPVTRTGSGARPVPSAGRSSGSHAAGPRGGGSRTLGLRGGQTAAGGRAATGLADDARDGDALTGRGSRALAGPGGTATGPARPGSTAPTTGRPGRGRSGQRPAGRRKHPVSVKLAVATALVLVVVAVATVYLGAKVFARHPTSAAGTTPKTTTSVAPSPTASLGPYGHIASRSDDPDPLALSQLYLASFTQGGLSFQLTNSGLSSDCVDAVAGANIQAAVSASSCTQVARATYLSTTDNMMGTIGVLNLQTAKEASKAVSAAGAGNFILQLPGHSGPTRKLGQGTGIEEATAKGHYLILMWAELTSLARPRTAAQRTGLADFMTELLQGTANVSLTNRMIYGSPSPAPPGG